MTTVTLWLLISIGYSGPHKAAPTMVVERFVTQEECVQLRDHLNKWASGLYSSNQHHCVQVRGAR